MGPWDVEVDLDDDEFTELLDGDFPRVDLVNKGANGIPFLIAKSDASGLMPAAGVRALLARDAANVRPRYTNAEADLFAAMLPGRDEVTISGSPAAVAKMIHPTKGSAQMTQVRKAKGDDPVAVYTADGKLVGLVESSNITKLGDASSLLGDDGAQSKGATPQMPGKPAPVGDHDELEPTPADTAGVPADAGRAVKKARVRKEGLVDSPEDQARRGTFATTQFNVGSSAPRNTGNFDTLAATLQKARDEAVTVADRESIESEMAQLASAMMGDVSKAREQVRVRDQAVHRETRVRGQIAQAQRASRERGQQ